jgi:hypothetical protein
MFPVNGPFQVIIKHFICSLQAQCQTPGDRIQCRHPVKLFNVIEGLDQGLPAMGIAAATGYESGLAVLRLNSIQSGCITAGPDSYSPPETGGAGIVLNTDGLTWLQNIHLRETAA